MDKAQGRLVVPSYSDCRAKTYGDWVRYSTNSPKKRASREQIQRCCQTPGNLPHQLQPLNPAPEVPFMILSVPIRLLINDILESCEGWWVLWNYIFESLGPSSEPSITIRCAFSWWDVIWWCVLYVWTSHISLSFHPNRVAVVHIAQSTYIGDAERHPSTKMA